MIVTYQSRLTLSGGLNGIGFCDGLGYGITLELQGRGV